MKYNHKIMNSHSLCSMNWVWPDFKLSLNCWRGSCVKQKAPSYRPLKREMQRFCAVTDETSSPLFQDQKYNSIGLLILWGKKWLTNLCGKIYWSYNWLYQMENSVFIRKSLPFACHMEGGTFFFYLHFA